MWLMRVLVLTVTCIVMAAGATFPPGFAETQVASGLDPTTMTFAPDGRLLLCEKPGRVRVVKNGVLLPAPMIDFSSVVDNTNERGLMSVCCDPQFDVNHYLYVFYTRKEGARRFNRVARWVVAGDVVQGNEAVVIDLDDLSSAGNHNGGGLRFGKDGKLYISTGENTNSVQAQSSSSLLGKLLRVNGDGSIPTDNPQYGTLSGAARAIVGSGLRNPFTLAIHRETGLIYINDVGAIFEEINRYDSSIAPESVNYGWGLIDGPIGGQSRPAGYRDPAHAYSVGKTAICGGDFYVPTQPGIEAFPSSYRGMYFFCDYLGWIRYIDPANPSVAMDFATGAARPIDVEIAPDGALWYIARAGMGGGSVADNTSTGNGTLWRVRWTDGGLPTALAVTQVPATTKAGDMLVPAVRVAVVDRQGATVASSNASVTVALTGSANGASLRGTTTVVADHGVATFSDLRIDVPGTGYAIVATSPGLTSATSTAVQVLAQAATPTITPDGGNYRGPVWIQVACATPGAVIRYTTDGSTPTAVSSVYTQPWMCAASATIRAVAMRDGYADSAVATAAITVQGNQPYGMDYRPTLTGVAMPSSVAGALPTTLSATGLFQDVASMTVMPGVVPFTVNSPLWSDGALKARWVALPGSAKIGFSAMGEFTWPGGTVLMKHFDLVVDEATNRKRRLETRLLVLDANGTNGYGVTYKWRPDEREADLLDAAGSDEPIAITSATGSTRSQVWHYPSRTQCLQCHTANAGMVLGPKTRQLNGVFYYPATKRSDQQLRTWNYLQMFTSRLDEDAIAQLPKLVPITDASSPLEARVRSYLDANCAGCHRPNGTGAAWDARFDVPMDRQGIINGEVRDQLGIAGARVVVPQDLAKSIMRLRMQSTDPVRQMPPLGRQVVHAEAVALLEQWIQSLPNGTGLRGEYWAGQHATFDGAPTLTRTDAVVDFQWGSGSPDPTLPADLFTARWTGKVIPAVSETYTFSTTSDDGMRLWINQQLVIDQWHDQAATEWSGSINLTAGQAYDVVLEYYENAGDAAARFWWSSASIPKEPVPMYRMIPSATRSQNFSSLVITPGAATVVNGSSIRFRGEARDDTGALLTTQPNVTWSVSGGGTIAADGTLTTTQVGGPFMVRGTVTYGGVTREATASVTVSAAFQAQINFQPASAPTVPGWEVDAGAVYALRSNGMTYGWNADVSDTLRDRNMMSDQLRDTLVHLQKPAVPDAVWEIAVPAGTYQVIAVSGDPGYLDSWYRTLAEDQVVVDGEPTAARRFVETVAGGILVVVRDGRLTLRSGAGARNNKLNSVEIHQVPVSIQ